MPVRDYLRPTYAEVDLGALRENYRKISTEYPSASLMPVIKADAYGHGAIRAAGVYEKEGAPMLGVATIEEGIELREAGIRTPVIVLGSVYPFENFSVMIEYSLTPAISSLTSAVALDEASALKGKITSYHLKIDTGMGRIGISPETAIKIWGHLKSLGSVECEGVFTHLSCADAEPGETAAQLERFNRFIDKIDPPRYIHAANTAGAVRSADSRFNLIRPGLALYGLYPEGMNSSDIELTPALSLKSSVVFLKEVSEGTGISYGLSWRAARKTKIATLCIGYADGFRRSLSNRGKVLIRGVECPVAGRVCMDMVMVDVGGLQRVAVGDEAVIIGRSGSRRISAEETAADAGTVNYEILTGISSRVPRIYTESDES